MMRHFTPLRALLSKSLLSLGALFLLTPSVVAQQTGTVTLTHGWRFARTDTLSQREPSFDDSTWQRVTLPHDWAIYGPFSSTNDRQNLAIAQDGQKAAMEHAGRTGGLPFVGVGWYRRHLMLPKDLRGKYIEIQFDGAMSNAEVYLNGKYVGKWPYGYNSFYFDLTPYAHGGDNLLAVRLDNPNESSRWYPGAGLYREVHLRVTDKTHIKNWGVQITTPDVSAHQARVLVTSTLEGLAAQGTPLTIQQRILDPQGHLVWSDTTHRTLTPADSLLYTQALLSKPQLWDIGQPNLYRYILALRSGHTLLDADTVTFGIRTIALRAGQGFFLNGRKIKFKGVCLHHDQGPLGACANEASMRRQIRLMQDMGANAIRTSHNMPDPKFVRLCDEMGMMIGLETFDSWAKGKVPHGYNMYFNKWYQRDLENAIRHYRNDPAVMLYFIGNEVIEQGDPNGCQIAYKLQEICHHEDPTRPVCNAMDNPRAVIHNNMAATLDIPGFNYRPYMFPIAKQILPQGFILGSETASTISSRGVYKFPVVRRSMFKYPDHQASSYDVEHCSWSNLPEDDWMLYDDMPWTMGEFVWTGFDYLGEPTPYYSDWPSHSSLFGIVDLAGLPKDRYYLYRSHWNTTSHTLHMLPHWTWHGREGQVTPIFVYTDYPEAEVWINGKSQGRHRKDTSIRWADTENDKDKQALTRQRRYRLMWLNTRYEPGTVKVVAYDKDGNPADSLEMHTAGKPDHLELSVDRPLLHADGKDIAFVTVKVVDKAGNLCPNADNLLHFKVQGSAFFRAAASGNPASLDLFHLPQHHAFSGMLTVLVQSKERAGKATLTITAEGLKPASLQITTR